MSIADLQSWLLDQGIEEELDQLTRHTVRGEIGNLVPEPDAVASPVDWQRLLLAASVLARSNTRSHQEAALRIATSAVTMSKSAAVIDAGAVLLGKLSNFRAVALAGKRALLADDLDGRLGMSLRIEAQRRQMDQAVLVESSGRWLQVNDFQQRFWENAAHRVRLPNDRSVDDHIYRLACGCHCARGGPDHMRCVIYVIPLRRIAQDLLAADGMSLLAAAGKNKALPDVDLLRLLFDVMPAEARIAGRLLEGHAGSGSGSRADRLRHRTCPSPLDLRQNGRSSPGRADPATHWLRRGRLTQSRTGSHRMRRIDASGARSARR